MNLKPISLTMQNPGNPAIASYNPWTDRRDTPGLQREKTDSASYAPNAAGARQTWRATSTSPDESINSIEKARSNPSLQLALRIGRLFRLPIGEIFESNSSP